MLRVGLMSWFVAAGAILAINSFICYRSVVRVNDTAKAVARTRNVIIESQQLLAAAVNAETGQRGYLLTGDEKYLAPFNTAGPSIDSSLAELAAALDDRPDAPRIIGSLRGDLDLKLAELTETIRLRRTGGLEATLPVVKLDVGKAAMDSLRARVDELVNGQEVRLKVLTADREAANRRAIATLIGAGVFNLFLLAGLAWGSRREARFRATAEQDRVRKAELSAQNLELTRIGEERRRTADAMRDLAARLQVSNRELQDFASVASHDLQEPLRKIQAFGDRLSTRVGPQLTAEGADYLQRMLSAAGRMQTLINDLLSFSRVTTKAQPFEPVDLSIVAADVVSDLEARVLETGAAVEVAPLPTIEADPTQMRQLLQNLIGNALKFRKPDVSPVVKVFVAEPNHRESKDLTPDAGESPAPGAIDSVELWVQDNGIGFDEKYLDRIFNVFQRLHGRNTYEGTGIGLAVCRKIAERHGGSITARSVPGEGAAFIVTLPVRHPETEVDAAAATSEFLATIS